MSNRTAAEGEFFRTLNALVEPLVRVGLGSPWIVPAGLIVLETTGRRSGRLHRTPVVAIEIQGHVLVSTVRGDRSEWIKNMRATPEVWYWLRGQLREATALVFAPGEEPQDEALPAAVRCAAGLHAGVRGLDLTYVVLAPRR